MAIKGLLVQRDTWALSAGFALTAPTGDDTWVYVHVATPWPPTTVDVPLYVFQHQSVHLMPFLGLLWRPNNRWFSSSYLQVDVDTNGDRIASPPPFVAADALTVGLVSVGRYRDQAVLYLDTSLGYWIYRNPNPEAWVTGLAPVLEVHVNQSLEKSVLLQHSVEDFSIIDLTVGLHTTIGRRATATVAYCTPVTEDRQFDSQFRFLWNWRF